MANLLLGTEMTELDERKGRPDLLLGSSSIWSPGFLIRDELKYEREDKSNLEQIEEQWDPIPEDDLFDFIFLRKPEQADRCSRETQRLRSFWAGATMKALKDGDGEAGMMKVAILHRGVGPRTDADAGDSRRGESALTSQRLYQEMSRKVSWPVIGESLAVYVESSQRVG